MKRLGRVLLIRVMKFYLNFPSWDVKSRRHMKQWRREVWLHFDMLDRLAAEKREREQWVLKFKKRVAENRQQKLQEEQA